MWIERERGGGEREFACMSVRVWLWLWLVVCARFQPSSLRSAVLLPSKLRSSGVLLLSLLLLFITICLSYVSYLSYLIYYINYLELSGLYFCSNSPFLVSTRVLDEVHINISYRATCVCICVEIVDVMACFVVELKLGLV